MADPQPIILTPTDNAHRVYFEGTVAGKGYEVTHCKGSTDPGDAGVVCERHPAAVHGTIGRINGGEDEGPQCPADFQCTVNGRRLGHKHAKVFGLRKGLVGGADACTCAALIEIGSTFATISTDPVDIARTIAQDYLNAALERIKKARTTHDLGLNDRFGLDPNSPDYRQKLDKIAEVYEQSRPALAKLRPILEPGGGGYICQTPGAGRGAAGAVGVTKAKSFLDAIAALGQSMKHTRADVVDLFLFDSLHSFCNNDFFAMDPDDMARVMLHESTHAGAGTGDSFYIKNGEYRQGGKTVDPASVSGSEKMATADSYAVFGQESFDQAADR